MPQHLRDPHAESIRALAAMVDAEMRTNDGGSSGAGQGGDGGSGSGSGSGSGDGSQGGSGGSGGGSGDGTGSQDGSGSSGSGDSGRRSDADRHLDSLLGGNGSGSGRSDGSGNGQAGDGGSGSGSSGQNLSESEQRVLDALTPHLEQFGNRIADRLVNAEGTRQRRSQRGGGNGNGSGRDGGSGREGNDRDGGNGNEGSGNRRDDRDDRSAGEQREAEQELRFELRDVRPRGASRADRTIAEAVGAGFLADNLADGQRPSRAARNAAESAHEAMEAFAKAVREETVASLRKRGAIKEGAGDGKGGGSAAAGGAGGSDSSTDNAIALAKQMAEQHNRHNGHPATNAGSAQR